MSDETKEQSRTGIIQYRNLFWLMLVLLMLVALFTHNKLDFAVLEGGNPDGLIRNQVGILGAMFSRAMLYFFGLAAFPIVMMISLSVVRKLIPIPLKRSGYFGAILAFSVSMTVLFAMWPERFLGQTDSLGIGRMEQSALALSGGVLGSKLAAPADGEYFEAGIVRRYIGDAGAIIAALILLIPSLVILFGEDWYPLVRMALRGDGKEKPAVHSSKPVIRREPEPESENSSEEPTESDREEPEDLPAVRSEGPSVLARILHKVFGFSPESDKKPEDDARSDESDEDPEDDADVPPAPPAPIPLRRQPEQQAVSASALARGEDDDDDYKVAPPTPGSAAFGAALVNRNLPSEPAVPPSPSVPEPGIPAMEPESEPSVQPVEMPHNPPEPVVHTRSARTMPEPSIERYADRKPEYDAMHPEHRGNAPQYAGVGPSCDEYVLPPVALLDKQNEVRSEDEGHIEQSRERLQSTLESFNVEGHVSEIVVGPRVTRFEISLAQGVKVEKVTGIQNNIAMDLAAESIRILAPIPGKNTVGIEVPNKVSSIVYIRSLMESPVWRENRAGIPIILGRDIAGKVMVTDLAKAPHLLIAGSTGSGKSVCMNTLVMSLLFKFKPSELRLIMVDPKVVELEMYRPLPHLITPVVNDPKKVPLALRWGVNEMERRYKVLARVKAKNLAGFNSRPQDPLPVLDEDGNVIPPKLPLVIIIIDELADIMMTEAKADVETSICRIAQKGRAAGLHLVIATQTPRKDVITGLIKANLPTKIAFKVGSNMDSRVILDTGGAEKLLGMGDMLFKPPGASGLERIQGSMVSDPEIQKVVDFVSGQCEQHFDTQVMAEDVEIKHSGDEDCIITRSNSEENPGFDEEIMEDVIPPHVSSAVVKSAAAKYLKSGDSELLYKALEIIINEQQVSTSFLQRRLGIGYNKSADLVDTLEQRGVISAPLPGGQKRNILITDGLSVNDPDVK